MSRCIYAKIRQEARSSRLLSYLSHVLPSTRLRFPRPCTAYIPAAYSLAFIQLIRNATVQLSNRTAFIKRYQTEVCRYQELLFGNPAIPAGLDLCRTTINEQLGAGDVGRFWAGKKSDSSGDFLDPAITTEGDPSFQNRRNLASFGLISVSIGPGCTILTVMPFAPRSRAHPLV